MAPKRTSSSLSSSLPSSSYLSWYFSTQAQETNYNLYYSDKELFTSHHLDEDLFKDWSIMEAFNFVGLRNFVFAKLNEIYPNLVRKFYANLTYTNGIVNSEIKKTSHQLLSRGFL